MSSGNFLALQKRFWSRVSYHSDQGPGFIFPDSGSGETMMAGVMYVSLASSTMEAIFVRRGRLDTPNRMDGDLRTEGAGDLDLDADLCLLGALRGGGPVLAVGAAVLGSSPMSCAVGEFPGANQTKSRPDHSVV